MILRTTTLIAGLILAGAVFAPSAQASGVLLDDAILAAKAAVDGAGIGAEPASCASVAGVRELVRRGWIEPGQRVVALLTGHLLKDPETTLAYHEGRLGVGGGALRPVEIDARLDDLRAALRG